MKQYSVFLLIALLLVTSSFSTFARPKRGDKSGLPKVLSNVDKDQIVEPRILFLPTYPTEGVLKGIEAEVGAKFKLAKDGSLDTVAIAHCNDSGIGFEKAAIRSVMKSDFLIKEGEKVDTSLWWYTRIPFLIKKSKWYPKESILIDDSYTEVFNSVSVDTMPILVYKFRPSYPTKARDKWIQAFVRVNLMVSKEGIPKDVTIYSTSDPYWEWGFNKAAIYGAERCKFEPAKKDGKPVRCWVTFPFEFTLSRAN